VGDLEVFPKPFWIWKHIHVHKVRVYEVCAHEVHAYEIYAYEIHALEMHVRKVLGSPTLQTVMWVVDFVEIRVIKYEFLL
jgi:hypothetical protein